MHLLKQNIWFGMIALAMFCFGLASGMYVIHPKPKPFTNEPQMAAGEWKIEMQTPPCSSVQNMQVIWPKESGYPVIVECDNMPVPTR